MRALGYLILTILKNKILMLKKKPAFLILYGFILLGIIVMIFVSTKSYVENPLEKVHADIRILYAIVSAIGLFFLITFLMTGLSSGSTLFSMADVGLTFVAPISSKKILIYGLVKQLGATLLSGIFILYQIGNIKESFGLDYGSIISIFIIYGVMLFFGQLLSIAIYIYSNGNQARKRHVYIAFASLVIIIAAFFYYQYYIHGGFILKNVLYLMDFKPFQYLPVVGWSVMFVVGIVEKSMIDIIIALLLFLVSGAAVISLFTANDADYYEDVLSSTEIQFNRLMAAKDGKMVNSMNKKIKVKEDETGLKKGSGASAIYYKHLLEKKRTSKYVYLDLYTLIFALGVGITCYFTKNEFALYIILGVLIYIQFFATILGKLSVELVKPYIYMIPEKSSKKIIYASLTTILKPVVDAVVFFTIACIISKTSPLTNIFLGIAYASSGALFISFTLLCQRILGGQPNKLIQSLLGVALFIIVLTPGISISVFAIMFLPKSLTFLATFPYSFCCIAISILVFVVCGDLVDKAEYAGR